MLGAWGFIAALAASPARPEFGRSARRAVAVAGVAAFAAAVVLAWQLATPDLSVSYVARHVALNLPPAFRVAAVWSHPAGAVLPTAALVSLLGVVATAGGRWPAALAPVAATILASMAASLAASPFAPLDWLPADGLGMAPQLQHPASVAGRLALSVLVAAAAAAVSAAVSAAIEAVGGEGSVTDEASSTAVRGWLVVAAAALGAATAGAATGGAATGWGVSAAPSAVWGGALFPGATVVVLAVWAQQSAGAASASLVAVLGLLGFSLAMLLGGGSPGGAMPLRVLAVGALVASGASVIGATFRLPTPTADASRFHRASLVRAAAVVLLVSGAVIVLVATPGAEFVGRGGVGPWLTIAGGIVAGLSVAAGGGEGSRMSVTAGLGLTAAGALVGGGVGALLAGALTPPAAGWFALAGAVTGCIAACVLAAARTERGGGEGRRRAGTAAWPGARPERVHVLLPRLALAAAVLFAALGEGGEALGHTETVSLTSGGTARVRPRFVGALTLAHQGVSRYQGTNAHLVAVALEIGRDGRQELVTAERREFVDSRETPVGAPMTPPAVVRTPWTDVTLRLEEVGDGDTVLLSLRVVPLASAWWLALSAMVIAAGALALPAHLAGPVGGTRTLPPPAAAGGASGPLP